MPRPQWSGIVSFDTPGMADRLAAWVRGLDRRGVYEVSVVPRRDSRTTARHRFYFAAVVTPFADFLRSQEADLSPAAAKEIAHALLKRRFLTSEEVNRATGEVIGDYVQSTTTLTVGGMSDYIERCRHWLLDFLNIETPDAGAWDDGGAVATAAG